MKIQTTDILTRREKAHKRTSVWVSESLLLILLSDLTLSYLRREARVKYKKTVRKDRRNAAFLTDTGKAWRYGRQDGQFYYDYDRIPDERRALLPSADELVAAATEATANAAAAPRLKVIEERFEKVTAAAYADYMSYYADETDEACHLLSRAACFLEALRKEWTRIGKPDRDNTLFKDAGVLSKRLAVRYFPNCDRNIKRKVDKDNMVVDEIKLPRKGNTNSLQFDDDSLKAMILMLRNDGRNHTDIWITRNISRSLELAGRKVPSESWFATEFAKPRTKFLTIGRYAGGRYAAQFESYVPVAGAAYAGDAWMMDGTRINMIPYKTDDGKMKHAYITVVYDVHSGDLLGWSLDVKEDRWAYIEALNMAVSRCGYLPYELVVDRFPGHNTEEWGLVCRKMTHVGVKVSVTSNKTGKARVERMFNTLQSVFMQNSDYFYGEGVKSKRLSAHRSPEYLRKVMKRARTEGWSAARADEEVNKILTKYRDTPLNKYSRRYATIEESPRQLHDNSEHPSAFPCDDFHRVDIFGLEKRVTMRNAGMITTVFAKLERKYQVTDEQVVFNHTTVRLAYDLDNLQTVHIFEDSDDANRAYLGEVHLAEEQPRYGPGVDLEEFNRARMRADHVARCRKEEMKDIEEEALASDLALIAPMSTDKEQVAAAETAALQESLRTNEPKLLLRELVTVDADDDYYDEEPPRTAEQIAEYTRNQY